MFWLVGFSEKNTEAADHPSEEGGESIESRILDFRPFAMPYSQGISIWFSEWPLSL